MEVTFVKLHQNLAEGVMNFLIFATPKRFENTNEFF